MKICVFGAGAIGGYIGARLASAGADVSLIARGPHLAALQKNGLTLLSGETRENYSLPCSDDPSALGPQDYVIIALKAHSIPSIVETISPLIGPDTAVVPAVNGVPWWYFYKLPGSWEGRRIETVDPGGKQWSVLGPERIIGCVVYPAAEIVEPGVVRHIAMDRVPLGEPSGERSERATALSKMLIAGGVKAPVRPRIRDDIWVKLWGNVSFNPVSVLTGATLKTMAEDMDIKPVIRSMMVEAQTIGEKLGVRFPIDVDRRIEGARDVGEHKTSTLQDFERGRPLEIDALVGAVVELGRIVGVPTPTIEMVLGLVRYRARMTGCLPT